MDLNLMGPRSRHLTSANDSFDDDDGDDEHLHKCRMANLTLLHRRMIEKCYLKGVKMMNLVIGFCLISPYFFFFNHFSILALFLHFRFHLGLNLE